MMYAVLTSVYQEDIVFVLVRVEPETQVLWRRSWF